MGVGHKKTPRKAPTRGVKRWFHPSQSHMEIFAQNLQNVKFISEENPDFSSLVSRPDGGHDCVAPLSPPRARKKGKKKPILRVSDSFYESFLHGSIGNDSLLVVAKRQLDKAAFLRRCTFSRNVQYFISRTNGTERYARICAHKCAEAVKAFAQDSGLVCFLTLTYAVNLFEKDRIESWQGFHAQVAGVTRALREKYRAQFLWVLESTKNGFPHAHIILFFPRGVLPELEKIPRRKKIRFGRLFTDVKKRVSSPVFDLEKADGKAALKYVLKYMNKGVASGFQKLLSKEGGLSVEERKALLTFVMPIVSGVRRFGYSEPRKLARKWAQEKEMREFIKKFSADADYEKYAIGEAVEGESFVPDPDPWQESLSVERWRDLKSDGTQFRRVLMKFCTKLSEVVSESVFGVPLGSFETDVLQGRDEKELFPSEIDAFFKKKGKEFYGAGLWLRLFLEKQGDVTRYDTEIDFVSAQQKFVERGNAAPSQLSALALRFWTCVHPEFEARFATDLEIGNRAWAERFADFMAETRGAQFGFAVPLPVMRAHVADLLRAAECREASENQKIHALLWKMELERRERKAGVLYAPEGWHSFEEDSLL